MPALDAQQIPQVLGDYTPSPLVPQEHLPPEWLGPGPADAGGLEAAAERLLGEIVIAVADGATSPIMALASYASVEQMLSDGVANLLAEGWPVFEGLQGYALAVRVTKPFRGDSYADMPDIATFIARCREDATLLRAGGPVRRHASTDITRLLAQAEAMMGHGASSARLQ